MADINTLFHQILSCLDCIQCESTAEGIGHNSFCISYSYSCLITVDFLELGCLKTTFTSLCQERSKLRPMSSDFYIASCLSDR